MKIFQKFIATILIVSMVLGLSWSIFLYKPKKAQAVLGVEDTVHDILVEIKEWIVDNIPTIVAMALKNKLQKEIIRWAQGGQTDENRAFAMLSWKEEIFEALNLASAKFINDFNLTALCSPFRFTIGERLGLARPYYTRPPYQVYAACTIGTVVDNVEEFFENPSIGLWGWDTWTALAQPQNNIYGSFLLAAERKAEIESEEKAEKEMQKDTGQGYRHDQECLTEQIMSDEELAECRNRCFEEGVDRPVSWTDACLAACDARNTGICLEYRTKNIGSTIHSAIEKAVQSDIDWLISADEITQMIGLFFSGLFNRLFHGTGLASKPFYRPTSGLKYQAEYSYYQAYKKALTTEDRRDLRRDILNSILKGIKGITTISYECDTDQQLVGDVFSEVAAEILDEETQHLYTGMEGVNLKPDWEVLDPGNAPYTTYGTTWEEIPFSKYPIKCSNIAGMRCGDIITGLPFELDIGNINPECPTGCLGRINQYRAGCTGVRKTCISACEDAACRTACREQYTACEGEAISAAVSDGACSSYAVGSACLEGVRLINQTKNRCDECLKKAQTLCPTEDPSCIALYCESMGFYNSCVAAETRNACYTCLKEYYIPARYCEIIYDFINRSFVKYPALAYEWLWWGTFNNFADCARTRSDPDTIPVGLTCRILPDFVFPGGGTCSSLCTVTADELKDTSDDQPRDSECSPREWRSGAFHPGSQYIPYLATKRAKCCPALTGSNPELYRICRGVTSDEPVVETPPAADIICLDPENEPEFCCSEGYRPLTQFFNTREGLPRYYCESNGFQAPNGVYKTVYACGNVKPGGAMFYIAQGSCKQDGKCRSNNPTAGPRVIGVDGPQVSCSHECDMSLTCANLNNPPDDSCTVETVTEGDPNPCGGPPSGIICEMETPRAAQGGFIPAPANRTLVCDLSGVSGNVNFSIYFNELGDVVEHWGNPQGVAGDWATGGQVCVKCDPSDPGYPNYGTPTDQCNNKSEFARKCPSL